MENQGQNTFTEIVEPLPKQKQKKRRKKTVSEIDLQIKELQKKKETLILKSTSEIGNFILSVLAEKDITVEDIENNQELFNDELETLLKSNFENLLALLK